MFRMNNEFSMAAMAVLVSAILHIVVIVVSAGGFLAPMLAGAVGWFLIGAVLLFVALWRSPAARDTSP